MSCGLTNFVAGEFSVDLYTLPDALLKNIWDYLVCCSRCLPPLSAVQFVLIKAGSRQRCGLNEGSLLDDLGRRASAERR